MAAEGVGPCSIRGGCAPSRTSSPGCARPRRRCAALFEPTPLQRNDFLSDAVRRRGLAEARGPGPGPLLQDPRRLQRHAQGARRAPGPAAVRLRLGRQPRAGARLRLPALRHRRRGVHAGDDAAAEDRQDPGRSAAAGSRSGWSATISTRRSPRRGPSPPRPTRCSCRRSTTPTSSRGRRRCALELLEALPRPRPHRRPGRRRRPRRRPRAGGGGAGARARPIRLVEPAGAPSLRRALEAGGLVTLPEVDNFVDGAAVARIGDLNFAVLGACRRRRRCCWRRRTASARRWSRC